MLDGEREVAVTLTTTVLINSNNNNNNNSKRTMRHEVEYQICTISTIDHYFRSLIRCYVSKRSTFPASRFLMLTG